MGSLLCTSNNMSWVPNGPNATYREMIQKLSKKKTFYKKIYFTRLDRNNTSLQGNKFTRLFNKKN